MSELQDVKEDEEEYISETIEELTEAPEEIIPLMYICEEGEFFDDSSESCKRCKYDCISCINNDNCLQCNESFKLIADSCVKEEEEK